MSRRWRASRYGASLAIAVAGVVCGVTLPGALGGTLATALIGIALVGVVSLVFYEVGLSEDRDRARRRPREPGPGRAKRESAPKRPSLRPARMRGHRRRLR